jgi:hypothetical protein
MTSAPGTVTQGVAHIKELVHNFVADIARQSPAEIFTDQARDASAPYPPRADVEYCVTLFPPPTDLWEELALDYIKELYVEVVTFFLKTENNKRRTINEVHRFFIITLLCGPNRAVRSREKQDDLWEGGVPQGDVDIQSRLIFTYPAHPELNQHMQDVRELFLDTFRTDPGDYDPRDPKPRDVWHHLQQSKDTKLTDLGNQGAINPTIEDVFGPSKDPATYQAMVAAANQRLQLAQDPQKRAQDLKKAQADKLAADKLAADKAAADKAAADKAAADFAAQAHQQAHLQAAAARQAAAVAAAAAAATPRNLLGPGDVLADIQARMGLDPQQLRKLLADAQAQASRIGPPPLPQRRPLMRPPLPAPPVAAPAAPAATLHPSLVGLNPAAAVAYPAAPVAGAALTPAATLAAPAAPTLYYTSQYNPATGGHIYTGLGNIPHTVFPGSTPSPQAAQIIAAGVGKVAIPQPHGFPLLVQEQVLQPNLALDATIRTMSSHGISPNDPYAALAIGTAAGVAGGIQNLVRNKKGPIYTTREVVQNIEQNCRVDSFDFNIYGLTVTEILGARFSNTTFQSEEARVAVA